MRTHKLHSPASREQELLDDFQEQEAGEEGILLEPVDRRVRDVQRTWGELTDHTDNLAASQKAAENFAPFDGVTLPKAVG